MWLEIEAIAYFCDGCGRELIQPKDEDMPDGYYIEFTIIDKGMPDTGKLWACTQPCLVMAIENRKDRH